MVSTSVARSCGHPMLGARVPLRNRSHLAHVRIRALDRPVPAARGAGRWCVSVRSRSGSLSITAAAGVSQACEVSQSGGGRARRGIVSPGWPGSPAPRPDDAGRDAGRPILPKSHIMNSRRRVICCRAPRGVGSLLSGKGQCAQSRVRATVRLRRASLLERGKLCPVAGGGMNRPSRARAAIRGGRPVRVTSRLGSDDHPGRCRGQHLTLPPLPAQRRTKHRSAMSGERHRQPSTHPCDRASSVK